MRTRHNVGASGPGSRPGRLVPAGRLFGAVVPAPPVGGHVVGQLGAGPAVLAELMARDREGGPAVLGDLTLTQEVE